MNCIIVPEVNMRFAQSEANDLQQELGLLHSNLVSKCKKYSEEPFAPDEELLLLNEIKDHVLLCFRKAGKICDLIFSEEMY